MMSWNWSEVPLSRLVNLTPTSNHNAKLLFGSCPGIDEKKFDHITPVLLIFGLHCHPVSYRIVFKMLLLVFKSLINLSPSYLVNRLSYQSHSRVLRSASKQLLNQPRLITKTYGDKASSVCAPKLWNSLPLDLCKSPSLTGFKKEKHISLDNF